MLREIHIKKLFGIFDYSIRLNEEGITILTGPNGYGKTTILKVINAISKNDLFFLLRLSFQEVDLVFTESDINIRVVKEYEKETRLAIYQGGERLLLTNERELAQQIEEFVVESGYLRKLDKNRWIDYRNDRVFDIEGLVEDALPEFSNSQRDLFKDFFRLPQTPDVHLIKEQRLLIKVDNIKVRDFRKRGETVNYEEAIKEYAKELRNYIANTFASYQQITQQLDSSFTKRLFDEQTRVTEEVFNQRFEEIKIVQKSLNKYGLFVIQEDNYHTYKEEDAKALAVYLKDTERKLGVFQSLLRKLDLFTNILNERRFTFKKIYVSKEDGFKFLTKDNQDLPLTELSSGEQQEVVLLFELLFKVNPGTLVLIDEPEISLHVAWQKEFLNDLIKITSLQKINTIIATHSPQIINERWDLTVDLEELIHETVS